ncbi:MAG: hypothetical protein JJE21_10075 [Spirochaetaceae bacterium]|nr:hypothetical protein [Spirochaetaceae bacterium]
MERGYGFNWSGDLLKSCADGHSTVDTNSTRFSIPAGVRTVRGGEGVIGANDYQDNSYGTIIDDATGLMWSQSDSVDGMAWESA